jgi:allantoin racemase
MKIWYQAMARENAWGAYHASVNAHLNRIKSPGTEIEVHGLTRWGGVADQFSYLEYVGGVEVLDNVHTAMRRGFDAFVIGNIADPALREAREIADIPVLGLCESTCHVACLMGGNFAFVTLNEKFIPRVVDNVDRYGLRSRFVGTRPMKLDRILNLKAGFSDPQAAKVICDEFLAAAEALVADGAEVVIAAGGVGMALLEKEGIHEVRPGVPVLNGQTALLTLAEAAVRIGRATGGVFTSKRLRYAPPSPNQIDEIRKYCGDVYPSVKSPSDAGSPPAP